MSTAQKKLFVDQVLAPLLIIHDGTAKDQSWISSHYKREPRHFNFNDVVLVGRR